jgi:hypothetical protein
VVRTSGISWNSEALLDKSHPSSQDPRESEAVRLKARPWEVPGVGAEHWHNDPSTWDPGDSVAPEGKSWQTMAAEQLWINRTVGSWEGKEAGSCW